MKLNKEQERQLETALCLLIRTEKFTSAIRTDGGVALVEYLAQLDNAPGVVSTVIDMVGDHARRHYDDETHMLLCQRSPAIVEAVAGSREDPEIARRVDRCVQWINGIFARDIDQVFTIWRVIESGEDAMKHDLAQALTLCQYLYADAHTPQGRAIVSTIPQED